MIDLSSGKWQVASDKKQTDDEPLGVVILTLMPFAWLFWALIEWGLR